MERSGRGDREPRAQIRAPELPALIAEPVPAGVGRQRLLTGSSAPRSPSVTISPPTPSTGGRPGPPVRSRSGSRAFVGAVGRIPRPDPDDAPGLLSARCPRITAALDLTGARTMLCRDAGHRCRARRPRRGGTGSGLRHRPIGGRTRRRDLPAGGHRRHGQDGRAGVHHQRRRRVIFVAEPG